MSMIEDDEDDWIELERKPAQAQQPDVSVRISPQGRAHRVWVSLRGDAADAIRAMGFRYRIQVGGRLMEKLRLIPDLYGGQFEVIESKKWTSLRLAFTCPNAWPAEPRGPTTATWARAADCMVLTLPGEFARPSRPALPPPAAVAAPQTKPASFPITTSAPGLQQAAAGARISIAKVGTRRLTPGEQRVMSAILTDGSVRSGMLQELLGCGAGAVASTMDSLTEKLLKEGYQLQNPPGGIYTMRASDLDELREAARRGG